MSSKNLKILAIIFVVLLAIAVYPVFEKEIADVIKPAPQNESFLSERINFDEVSSLDITNGDLKVEIRRHDDGWRVNDKKADESKIRTFVNELNNMTIGDQVSKNKENQFNFGVDDERGFIVKIVAQNKQYDLVVGNRATTDTFYVRMLGSNEVYLAKGGLKKEVSTSEAMWRDKIIVSLNKEELTQIEYSGTVRFTVEKVNNIWQYTKTWKKLDLTEEEVNKFINLFSPLNAFNFASEEETATFESARSKSTIKIYKGSEVAAELFLYKEPTEKATEDSAPLEDGTYMVKNLKDAMGVIYKIHESDILGLTELANK